MTDVVAFSTLVLLIPSPRAAELKMVPKWRRACSMFCAGAKLAAGTIEGSVDRIAGVSAKKISKTDALAGNRKVAPTAAACTRCR